MRGFIIAFTGGGCDGEFLAQSGENMTRERTLARYFRTRESAAHYVTGYRLLGWNRPRRAVKIVPAMESAL